MHFPIYFYIEEKTIFFLITVFPLYCNMSDDLIEWAHLSIILWTLEIYSNNTKDCLSHNHPPPPDSQGSFSIDANYSWTQNYSFTWKFAHGFMLLIFIFLQKSQYKIWLNLIQQFGLYKRYHTQKPLYRARRIWKLFSPQKCDIVCCFLNFV